MFIGDKDDSQDLGDWVVQQPWSNGQIYTFGASADGIASYQVSSNIIQNFTNLHDRRLFSIIRVGYPAST